MKKVHCNATDQMRKIFDKLSSMSRWRVIDIGCGGCELANDLLAPMFKEIHFLDRNEDAIR